MERRNFQKPAKIEVREDDNSKVMTGYAAVFYREDVPGTEFGLWDNYVERIMPGAFDRALAEGDDVRALFNHDSNHILGRTKSGTCRLSVDEIGLRYEVDLPDTQVGRDVETSIKRGDLDGSSFAFIVDGVNHRSDGQKDIREINSVTLMDVGPVSYPAYTATTTDCRGAEADLEAWQAKERKRVRDRDEVNARLTVLRIDENSL